MRNQFLSLLDFNRGSFCGLEVTSSVLDKECEELFYVVSMSLVPRTQFLIRASR